MEVFLFLIFLVGFLYLRGRIQNLENLLGGEKPREFSMPSEVESPAKESSFAPQEIPAKTPLPKRQEGEFEFKFGSQVFTGIGAVAVMLGVGFFLKYAFDNNLITEIMRIVLGLAGGLLLAGIGEFTRRKYPLYGQILTGGGIGILYLSLFAAFAWYHLLSQFSAFFGMIIVTSLGVALAIRHDSVALAGFAVFGGFLTPFLLSTGENNPHQLFLYIALLDIGVAAIAFKKLWRMLALGAFFGTVLVYNSWFIDFFSKSQWVIAEVYATLFFGIFLAISFLAHYFGKASEDEADLLLVTVNPALYFFASYAIIHGVHPGWAGGFTGLLSLFYFVLAYLVGSSDAASKKLQQFFAGVGVVLLVLIIPIQFDGKWITIGWALEVAVLTYLGFATASKYLRVFALGVFVLAFIRLLAFESIVPASAVPWANDRVFTYIIAILCFTAAAALYRIRRHELDADEKVSITFVSTGTYLLVGWLCTIEILDFHNSYWLSILWPLIALGGGAISFAIRSFGLRLAVYATFLAALFRLFVFESAVDILTYTPIVNDRVYAFAVALLAMSAFTWLLYQKDRDESRRAGPILFVAMNIMLLWLVSKEILDYFNQRLRLLPSYQQGIQRVRYASRSNTALSIAWAVYAIALLVLGIIKRSSSARTLSIILFGIVIFKVFLYDTASLNNFYRFISFITLGVILLLTGYLYHRYRDRIAEFIKADAQV